MARKKTPGPTEAELVILRILWNRGPSTVRQVNEELNRKHPTGYTTTLKQMQIMTEKGILLRDDSQRTHLYRVKAAKEKTQHRLVCDLLDKAFNGSAEQLVLRALTAKKVSNEELKRIQKLLDALEGEA